MALKLRTSMTRNKICGKYLEHLPDDGIISTCWTHSCNLQGPCRIRRRPADIILLWQTVMACSVQG